MTTLVHKLLRKLRAANAARELRSLTLRRIALVEELEYAEECYSWCGGAPEPEAALEIVRMREYITALESAIDDARKRAICADSA